MIKLPVKDPDTVPWMSRREIPAIKAVLSAWRRLRREDRERCESIRTYIDLCQTPQGGLEATLFEVSCRLEKLAAIDERLRKEAKNVKQS